MVDHTAVPTMNSSAAPWLFGSAVTTGEPTIGSIVYLAISEATWQLVFTDALGEILIDDHVLRVVTFDPTKQEIVRWIP